jgi:hypothetical protein
MSRISDQSAVGGHQPPRPTWPEGGRGEASELARIWRAMMLSPSLEVCEALLRGEIVPVGRLDAEWVVRFGLRR